MHAHTAVDLGHPPGATGLIPAIGYIRVSKAREEMISPELQRVAITEWARRRGRVLVDVVEDPDVSGRHWQRKIMRVIERIEAGEATEVIVWKYSRFGRDMAGCAVNLGRILAARGELQSATEDIDATTAVGQLSRNMLMAIAAFESERTSEGWRETWAWRVEHGLPPHGGPRIGYKVRGRLPNPVGGGTVRDPAAAEVYEPDETSPALDLLPAAYRAYVDETTRERGLLSAATLFNGGGVRTVRGNLFSAKAAGRLLDAGFAAGFLYLHDPTCTQRHTPGKPCTNKTHLPGAHSALIDLDTWEDYREKRRQRATQPRGTRGSRHLYTGRIWCGDCQGRHSGRARGHAVRYTCAAYENFGRCSSNSIDEAVITPVVLDLLGRYIDRIDMEARAAAEASADRPRVDTQAARKTALTADRDRIAGKLSRLLDAHLDGRVDAETYKAKEAELVADRTRADAELDGLVAAEETAEQETARVEVARGLIEEWDTLPAGPLRALVHQVVERVEVHRQSRSAVSVTVTLYGGDTRTEDVSPDHAANGRAGNTIRWGRG